MKLVGVEIVEFLICKHCISHLIVDTDFFFHFISVSVKLELRLHKKEFYIIECIKRCEWGASG